MSLDGVKMRVRGEGWKEVKVASFSVVEREERKGKAEPEVRLSQHSDGAGLWEVGVFAHWQWAEALRRGIQRVK